MPLWGIGPMDPWKIHKSITPLRPSHYPPK